MSVFKCKMCGGDLEILDNATVCECEYCGTKQTVPTADNEKKYTLFNRANKLRLNNEFDKAAGIYESIVSEFPDEAESYWGLVLCKYGIEYVDDKKTAKKIPTCHRTVPSTVLEDENFIKAIECAETKAKTVYKAEARAIDRLQKKILKIVEAEEPYDIFICYKETDSKGQRTEDSAIAQDIYTELVKEGYKVFFSRVTLRDKAGTDYEPYIYSALNSAKVMLAIGTKEEYYDAVWVKNEWGRYLSMMADDKTKHLIPCYKDLDAYDIPNEFKNLQALNMADVTFFKSLFANVKRFVKKNEPKAEAVAENTTNSATEPLLKRTFMFLEDGNFENAKQYAEKVLDLEPENVLGYLALLMVESGAKTRNELSACSAPFDNNLNYQKIIRFGSKELVDEINGYIKAINDRNLENYYNRVVSRIPTATKKIEFEEIIRELNTISDYKDVAEKIELCNEKIYEIEEAEKSRIYTSACTVLDENREWLGNEVDFLAYEEAIKALSGLEGWRDSNEKLLLCQQKLLKHKQDIEKARKEEEERKKREELARQEAIKQEKKKKKVISVSVVSAISAMLALVFVINNVILPSIKYKEAISLMESGKYEEAVSAFTALDGYKDSNELISEYYYNNGISLLEQGDKRNAITAFSLAGDYKDSNLQFSEILKEIAVKETVSAGSSHTVGLKSDGTVVATDYIGDDDFFDYYGQCDVSGWTDIVAISAGNYYTVGLKSDGTVVAVGENDCDQCNVSGWTDIVAISAGRDHTVGLKSDGTVVAVGWNGDGRCDVSGWTDIVAISAGNNHTVGLKSDGTVVATDYIGDDDDYYGQCDVSGWTDIVAISAASEHTVGLKSDGTVVATDYIGYYFNGDQCDVSGWTDIVAISASWRHTVGLKSDGTVVAVGWNSSGERNVSGWTDIVAISAGWDHTVGLKSDGTVVVVGDNDYGQSNVSKWKNIKLP